MASNANGAVYTAVDSDGDGVPGHALIPGPFPGFTAVYDFTIGDPPPDIDISVSATGGMTQECSEKDGSTIEINASISLIGNAELGTVEWFLDGQTAGTGVTVTPFLTLGTHTVDALPSTTTGETDSDSLILTVRDTLPPVLDVAFIDQAGNPVTVTSAGNFVNASILANDISDPAPVTNGTSVPVFEINNGDTIKIQSGKVSTVELPTTALELSATATDASGNSSNGMKILTITD